MSEPTETQPHHHSHEPHDHEHGHDHTHRRGLRGVLHGLFVPHSHDPSESVDDAAAATGQGIRAVQVSLAGLGATAVAQLVIALASGSVALLADTIHNFSDALTAVPLWIAFALGRRRPTRTFTWGYGRAEDLAGLFVVAMIALSAVLAGYQSISRLIDPQPLHNIGWVLTAGVIGFVGNELIAIYRIRAGRRIGSAALVADGLHARTDGFTSLAVVLGGLGVLLGFPLADPIVGLIITAAIAVLLGGTVRDVGKRLLDGIDPRLLERAERAISAALPDAGPATLALRWSGHRLHVTIHLPTDPTVSIGQFLRLTDTAEHALRAALPNVGTVTCTPDPETSPTGPSSRASGAR